MADLGALPRLTHDTQPVKVHQAPPNTDSGRIVVVPSVDAAEDSLELAADGQDVAGREGLLGKLQSKLSISLSRLSLDHTPKPFQHRNISLKIASPDANWEATKLADGRDATSEGVSSPSLNALMPFVPLMFRRDLLLPEPTFSAMQVCSCNP